MIVCLCPTFGRPQHILNNTVWLFEQQSHEDRFLIILDDLGNVSPQEGDGWIVVSTSKRFASMPEKYNQIIKIADSAGLPYDGIAQWDDDDIYLPHHLSAIDEGFKTHKWVYPSKAMGDYGCEYGKFNVEPTGGRFSATIGVSKKMLDEIKGWPITDKIDFDQKMVAKCLSAGKPYDPIQNSYSPSFLYRWGTTQAKHCSSAPDSGWYTQAKPQNAKTIQKITPKPDEHTGAIFEQLCFKNS